ncbi:MAG: FAD-dependent oxidoreductase [Lentisphaeria bacterium]
MDYDLAVIGGGSGGFGAALAAARAGLSVALVEREPALGGTSTRGGVNCWEPGVGGTGIPFDLYRRLKRTPQAVGIYSFDRHFCWQDGWYWPQALEKVNFPGGITVIDPGRTYRDTLRRHPEGGAPPTEAFSRRAWHGVVFEPDAMARAMAELLAETGRCSLLLNTVMVAVEAAGGVVRAVRLDDARRLVARHWVDGTGDGRLCAACGCEQLRGLDPRSRFQEPSAPETAAPDRVNGVTLIYRVTPLGAAGDAGGGVEPLPPKIPDACWWAAQFPPVCCNHYPNGDRNLNMLPTLEGGEFLALGEAAARREAERRVRAHWHFLQVHWPEFRRFRLSWTAPLLGVREGPRTVCEGMLTEADLRRGLGRQEQPDWVAVADHPLDRHGEGGGCPELAAPYGIPYRCLIPKGFHNLLVASRAAGFSSIAASSARLSRTVMQLGQAAGTAAALAREAGVELPAVPPARLRAALQRQHVQLAWPLPAELETYLSDE